MLIKESKQYLLDKFEQDLAFSRKLRWERLKERPVFTFSRAVITRFLNLFKNKVHLDIRGVTFWGERIFIPLPVSLDIYQWGFINGEPEIKLTKYFIKSLKPADVFLDIGAHCGFYTGLASLLVGPNGSVHSFEPTPKTFSVLKKNFSDRNNVFLNPLGVWSSKTEIDFFDFGDQHSVLNNYIGKTTIDDYASQFFVKPRQIIKVKTTTIDDYVSEKKLSRVDFIKIDVEGAEPFVLYGARKTIDQFHPILSIEILGEKWRKSDDDSLFLLKSLGYNFFFLDQDANLVPFSTKNLDCVYENLIALYER